MKKDLTNIRFGKLVALDIDKIKTGNGIVYWNCKCDCGNTTSIRSSSLTRKRGGTISCGCAINSKESKEKTRITKEKYPDDITNYKFGRLTVLRKTNVKSLRKSDNGSLLWECQCECGELCYYSHYHLVNQKGVRSCGCLYNDSRKFTNKKYCEYDLTSYDFGVGYCNNGTFFLFDKEDYNKIKDYSWWYDGRYVIAHSLHEDKYTTAIVRLHRVVMDISDREDINIDHKNLIRYDCRKINLRKATDIENSRNKDYSYMCSSSGITGVRKRNNKWAAYININKKTKCIGCFDTIEEAIESRLKAEVEYYKDFRYIPNFYNIIDDLII